MRAVPKISFRLAILLLTTTGWLCSLTAARCHAQLVPRRSLSVYALGYYTLPDGTSGGRVHPLGVTVGGVEAGKTRVGFFESEVGGSGDQWRSAGWNAVLTAAQITEFQPAATQVAFDIQGQVDGPSAGAMMTVAVIAATRGDTIADDAAMTGTINPDGMIGPVGGIRHKIAGAAGAGLQRVLIPAGLQIEIDEDDQATDLIQHGQTLGVEVIPVGDIYEAYEVLTGVRLREPPLDTPLPPAKPKFREMTLKKIRLWNRRYQTALATYQALPESTKWEESDERIEMAKESARSAENLIRENRLGAALDDAVMSAVVAYIAMEWARSYERFERGGMERMQAHVRSTSWLDAEIAKCGTALRYYRPTTLDQASCYLSAASLLMVAEGYNHMGRVIAANPAEDVEDLETQLLEVGRCNIIAWLNALYAQDCLDIAEVCEGHPMAENAPIQSIARFYDRGVDANTAVFDSLMIDPTAKSLKLSPQVLKLRLMEKDEDFAIVEILRKQLPALLDKHFGQGRQRDLAYLAGVLTLHHYACGLVAKYYSLDAELDENMYVKSYRRESALNRWLDRSTDLCREKIRRLKQDFDMDSFHLDFEAAEVGSRRDATEKLGAFETYFSLNVFADVLRRFAAPPLPASE